MKKLPSMRLLVCDTAENAAEALLGALAKAGIAATARRVSGKAELFACLARPDWDLLLLNDKVGEVETRECAACVREHKHCMAIVVLTAGRIGVAELAQCYRQGAVALVSLDALDYSLTVIGREFVNVQNRRRQIELARENAELAERCRLLLGSSREAIAYLHDGMHVHANESYRTLYAFADAEELTATPFIDMVADTSKEALRRRLKEAQAGAHGEAILIGARRIDGSTFKARVAISPTLFEGEKCLQVIVAVEEEEAIAEAPAPAPEPELEARPVNEPACVIPLDTERRAEQEYPFKDALPRLIADRQGEIIYQPVIAVSDMEPEFHAMELHLRDPSARVLEPEDYLEAVNQAALGRKLDQWSLEQALATLARHDKLGERLQFLVNLSAQSLSDPRFAESCAGHLALHGLDNQSLIPGLRQGELMRNPEQARMAIERLQAEGLRVCLNDFAASPASLDFIREARIRLVRLKRDASRRILEGGSYGEELAKLVAKLHDEGVKVIATRVNDTATLSALWQVNVDLVQGSLLPNLDTAGDAGAAPPEPMREQSAALTRRA